MRLLAGAAWMAMTQAAAEAAPNKPGPLDPQGRIHVPIGIANTVDALKTFVEAEGCFSPGVGSYGVYFWLYDPQTRKLTAPTMPDVPPTRGLTDEGYPIPWTAWRAGAVDVRTEVCHVRLKTPAGDADVVGARVHLANAGKADRPIVLYAALRGLGAAGWPVKHLAAAAEGDALLVDGAPALVARAGPAEAAVTATDTIGQFASRGEMPLEAGASSEKGECSGAIRLHVIVPAGKTVLSGFVCPVLPGRRAVGHDWDGTSGWAQLDLAKPNPPAGGALQPNPGLAFYRKLDVDKLFEQAAAYWRDLVGRSTVALPDRRWAQALVAIAAHGALTMNEGAPDVAVVNYNVFNRDGVYIANILQKAGRFDLSAAAIDYFLAHPFNGRTRVEADNPGQVLWAMGTHWLYARDRAWLARVYPAAAKIAAMVRCYRTTPGPHYVKATSLDFGDALQPDRPDERPAHRRQVLRPGSCDGTHPEYTEAFDIAGLRAASVLAAAAGNDKDAASWRDLAERLFAEYDKRFGGSLARGYGSYSVLWPCRLYPLSEGKAHEQFRGIGAQKPGGWRYFALARAHQGLLAGSREAAWKTIAAHLDHPQMQGWYLFDEGGRSGPGGWAHLKTTWPHGVAMPHGWAIAELHLLIRDALLFEDGDRLVLFGGLPEDWFTHPAGLSVEDVPTPFGALSLAWQPAKDTPAAVLRLAGKAAPPGGFVLRLPAARKPKVTAAGKALAPAPDGDVLLPPGTTEAAVTFGSP